MIKAGSWSLLPPTPIVYYYIRFEIKDKLLHLKNNFEQSFREILFSDL